MIGVRMPMACVPNVLINIPSGGSFDFRSQLKQLSSDCGHYTIAALWYISDLLMSDCGHYTITFTTLSNCHIITVRGETSKLIRRNTGYA
jgi:hypothetical protein